MIIREQERRREHLATGLAILAVGVLIGAFLEPFACGRDVADAVHARVDARLHHSLRRHLQAEPAPGNGLPTLGLDIAPQDAAVIQKVRDQAMERGIIIQTDDDTVPATITFDGTEMAAEVRIKGDWIDHVQSDKWSFRINLKKDKLLGMRTFSIQSPPTRAYLWEWLVVTAARRDDILAPRATFVNVVINGNSMGVFLLEGHFRKEMLESMGRREGPIVLLDEGTLWDTLLQTHRAWGITTPLPAPVQSVWDPDRHETRAFEEGRLGKDPVLSRTLHGAVEKIATLQRAIYTNEDPGDKARLYFELEALKGQTVDDLMDIDRLARCHAFASLFQISHSMIWHNMRFYHNPMLDRLEPILFDNTAQIVKVRDPVVFIEKPIMREFSTSLSYYNGVFRDLAHFCRPEYLDDLFADLDEDLERYAAALQADGVLPPWSRPAAIRQRLRSQQIYLKSTIEPADPINFSCFYELDPGADPQVSGTLEVNAWATTWAPVVLEAFRFSNGQTIPALACLADDRPDIAREGDGGVVLPRGGRHVAFTLSMNERMASLENVRQIKQAIREQVRRAGKSATVALDAVYRPIAASEFRSESLRFLKRDPEWIAGGGRPALPTLEQALQRYDFLRYDFDDDKLYISQGEIEVEEDLLIPRGHPLHVLPGTRLHFRKGTVLLSESPLLFTGLKDSPIVLEPTDGQSEWSGVVVLQAPGQSVWEHVVVRGTNAVDRHGWSTTGGVTFYGSPVTIKDCRIDGATAEDGLNIFGTSMHLERLVISGCASDSFDGDFVTGAMKGCRFENGLGDGVDFSGSDCTVERCSFVDLGDKAISAGEDSRVEVIGGLVERTTLGVVAKDSSRVDVEGLELREITNYAFAAYVKKPEFGPSSIEARGVTVGSTGLGASLVQTGCSLNLNGEVAATQRLDVDRLYREKILGN